MIKKTQHYECCIVLVDFIENGKALHSFTML